MEDFHDEANIVGTLRIMRISWAKYE